MVVNFRAYGINQDARKLARTLTLIIIIKKIVYVHYHYMP